MEETLKEWLAYLSQRAQEKDDARDISAPYY